MPEEITTSSINLLLGLTVSHSGLWRAVLELDHQQGCLAGYLYQQQVLQPVPPGWIHPVLPWAARFECCAIKELIFRVLQHCTSLGSQQGAIQPQAHAILGKFTLVCPDLSQAS